VHAQDEGNAHLLRRLSAGDRLDGVAVPGELLLVAVSETDRLIAIDEPVETFGSDSDPLDRAGGANRLDSRLARKRTQKLWELVPVQLLAATAAVDPREDRPESRRLVPERALDVLEALRLPSIAPNYLIRSISWVV